MMIHPLRFSLLSFVLAAALVCSGLPWCLAAETDNAYILAKPERTLEAVKNAYRQIPPLKFMPAADRWQRLPRTATILGQGQGEWRVVMLGDSIVNDTSRSNWDGLLQELYPHCKITKTTCVRGSTGCWWYKEPGRVQRYVLDHKPDLLIIGGISQRDDIDSIRDVIRQVRDKSNCDILLMSGAFGDVDPRDDRQWTFDIPAAGDDYRARLKHLAEETGVAFLDMTALWGKYVRESGKDLDYFKRDPIHANERGEQILGRILLGYFTDAPARKTGIWDLNVLSVTPRIFEAPEHNAGDVKAIFYEALPWKGKPTRVFAYYGVPKVDQRRKVPAMVLVHGGGGTAFESWVRLWVGRGYAAIAMDTCGCISGGEHDNRPRHEYGGPPGWGGFDQIDQPVKDQWTYHAVADIILAHSLIRSFPHVDPDKIGVTGVSWGGYLVCIVAGVDSRFQFAAPVYGCGFLGDNSYWATEQNEITLRTIGPEKAGRWLKLWDPSVYLPDVEMPTLWLDGTNDFAYPLDSLRKSYRLPRTPRTLCVRVRMPHGHGEPSENPKEIHVFAEAMFSGAAPLARLDKPGRDGQNVWVTFKSQTPIVKAELNYTKDIGKWQDRTWHTAPATLDAKGGKVSAALPSGSTVYYFNLIDQRNLIVSSEHEEVLSK
jgi:dienelactone hydrolase